MPFIFINVGLPGCGDDTTTGDDDDDDDDDGGDNGDKGSLSAINRLTLRSLWSGDRGTLNRFWWTTTWPKTWLRSLLVLMCLIAMVYFICLVVLDASFLLPSRRNAFALVLWGVREMVHVTSTNLAFCHDQQPGKTAFDDSWVTQVGVGRCMTDNPKRFVDR